MKEKKEKEFSRYKPQAAIEYECYFTAKDDAKVHRGVYRTLTPRQIDTVISCSESNKAEWTIKLRWVIRRSGM